MQDHGRPDRSAHAFAPADGVRSPQLHRRDPVLPDIYRAVAAEADAAGQWYYARVTAEDIAQYLESAVAAGIATLK